MKKLLLFSALLFLSCKFSSAQIICIFCYDQNDSISSNVNNLLQNGGFESGCVNGSFCPASIYYTCDIPGWTCVGGGTSTYCQVFDSNGAWYGSWLSIIEQGKKAVYMGNFYCWACSANSGDISCISAASSCTMNDLPVGYPTNTADYGGTNGIGIEQTVTGLQVGHTYVLEFWAGGEYDYGSFGDGIFAVDVGFGDTLLSCKGTGNGDIGKTYLIEFNATSSTQTIKFTNWGHVSSSSTEVVLDNVRLYTLAELSSSVPPCSNQSIPGSFAASDTVVCEKFCVNFYDSSANNPIGWQWIFPGGTPSSSTLQNPTSICYQTPGVFDVTLITTTASGTDSVTYSNYITVNPTPPFPTITQVGYTLTSSPSTSYQWQFNSVDIPGATNQSYIVPQTGYYTVVVGDANGCVNSFTVYVLISGINAIVTDANISVFPNPATNDLMVEWLNSFVGDEITLSISNAIGQEVYYSEEKISFAAWKKQIDLTDIPQGIYFMEIRSSHLSFQRKITIQ